VKIADRLANVSVANLGQLFHHTVDHGVTEVFRIAESFGNKNADQATADYFILLPGYFTVWVEPGQQGFERFFVDDYRSPLSKGKATVV
jgi:hypothetical protein